MIGNTGPKGSPPYTVTEAPLTITDKIKLRKSLLGAFKMNILLVPFLIILFFWGWLYFGIFAVFEVGCNIVFMMNYSAIKQQLNNSKQVFTG